MHAAYIEAESRLKRHRGAGPGSPRENRIETRVCYDIVRRVERGGGWKRWRSRGRGGKALFEWRCLFGTRFIGATLSAKGPKG